MGLPPSSSANIDLTTAARIAERMGDRLFELCDAIELVMEANPTGSWTPSSMGRSIHAATDETRSALDYMVMSVDKVDCDDRGCWTHYYALSTDARARKLYHS